MNDHDKDGLVIKIGDTMLSLCLKIQALMIRDFDSFLNSLKNADFQSMRSIIFAVFASISAF